MKITSFQHYLDQLHERFASLDNGAIADYIPELFKADPEWFGIAIVTVDGHVYQSGDTHQPFSIQSISKAFTYGIALEDKGEDIVSARIDVEPSGEAFNSISLEPDTGRPRNPMIDAEELERLHSLLQEESFQAGGLVCKEGELADKLYFLSSGRVSVSLKLDHTHRRRLGAYAAGWAFGESALFKAHTRTADIIADTDVQLYSFNPVVLREMDDPVAARVLTKLLSNLSELSLARLERANHEIKILTR